LPFVQPQNVPQLQIGFSRIAVAVLLMDEKIP
jgi:hypothetical protein